MYSKRETSIILFVFGMSVLVVTILNSGVTAWLIGYLLAGVCMTLGVQGFIKDYRAKHKN